VLDAAGRPLATAGSAEIPPGAAADAVVETSAGPALLATAPFDAGEARGGTLALLLPTAGIDAVVSRARRGVLAATVAALLLALGALAILERARARAAVEAEAHREREERDRRLASLGELGAGVAHEIRNPLNAVDLAVQRLAREVKGATPEDAARLAEMTGIVRREVKGLDRLVDSFLRFARAPDARLAPVDLAAAVRAEAALFAPEAEARGVRVEVREEPPVPPVALDAALFAQALRNLLRNALEASPPGGPVEVVVGAEGAQARVEVRDRGPGIPAAERDRVFEFFHTKKEGGTGLGLPLALRSVRSHGGTIVLRDGAGGGARFVVLLPAAEVPA
jgi:signal transduction histidine kinase